VQGLAINKTNRYLGADKPGKDATMKQTDKPAEPTVNIFSRTEGAFFAFGLSLPDAYSTLRGLGYRQSAKPYLSEKWENEQTGDICTLVYIEAKG
jgi:hypothetical protein